jgi:hypothetical protein
LTEPLLPTSTGGFARVCLTTTAVTAIPAVWLWAARGPGAAVGLAAGAALGLLMLSAVILVVEHTIRAPGEKPARSWPFWTLHAGKYLLAGTVIYALLRWLPAALGWFALGYGIPIAVIFLKSLGNALNRRVGVD